MSFASRVSLLALRRLTERARIAAENSSIHGKEWRHDQAFPFATGVLPDSIFRQSARRTWLALELALAGSDLWDHVVDGLSAVQGNSFRQQMEALVDLFALAGLETDSPEVVKESSQEIRSARQSGLLIPRSLDDGDDFDPSSDRAFEELSQACQEAGLPRVAELVGFRSLGGDSLVALLAEFFLHRAVCDEHEPGADLLQMGEEDSDICWRNLSTIALVLDRIPDQVESILDGSEELLAKAPSKKKNEQAIAQQTKLGLSRFHNGDYRQAAIHFTAALKLDPSNAVVYAQRGDAYRLQCEYERAIADYHSALRLNGAAPHVLVSRAIAYHLAGDSERAIADCTAALNLRPQDATALRTRAAAYADQGSRDLAVADLNEAVQLAPNDDEAFFHRGVLAVQKGEHAQAIADFTQVLKLNPHHVLAFLNRGHAHRSRGAFALAIRDYADVLRHHPGNSQAYRCRGLAHERLGNLDRAIADYGESLALEPDTAQVYSRRGVLYRMKKEYALALADFEQALRRQPENPAVLYHRCKIHLTIGQPTKALADVTELLAMNPKLVVAHLTRALIHLRLGLHEKAIGDSAEAIRVASPVPAAAYLIRGLAYSHLGEHDFALQDLNQAIESENNLGLAYSERCAILVHRGKFDQALEDCDRLIAIEPHNAHAYVQRSIVHHSLGNLQQALVDYAQSLQLDSAAVMARLGQGGSEQVRAQTSLWISDYIDGVQPKRTAIEVPAPPEFTIVIEMPKLPGQPSALASPNREEAAPAPAEEVQAPEERQVPRTAKPRRAAPRTATNLRAISEKKARAPKTEVPPAPKTGIMPATEDPEPESDAGPESEATIAFAEVDTAAEADTEAAMPANDGATTEEIAEVDVDALLTNAEFDSPEGDAPTEQEKPAQVFYKLATCVSCRTVGNAEMLPGGRVRCGTCGEVFNPVERPVSAVPVATPAKAIPKKRVEEVDDDEDDASLVEKLKKPIPLTILTAASLFVLWMFFPSSLFGWSNRVAVYPVKGTIQFEGKSLDGATLMLKRADGKDPEGVPIPRAVVQKDGKFAFRCYGEEDGAPPGEYKLVASMTIGGDEYTRPKQLLPAKYQSPQKSDIVLTIQEESNELPPIMLKKR